MSEYHFNGIGGGIVTSSGVGGVSSNIGGRGTMYVDILSIAPDGSLNVRISEWVKEEPRARAAYTCAVYGSTAVVCPSVPAPSEAEWVLLSYLGRRFVDGAPWDARNHWQRKNDTARYLMVEDFTIVDGSDPKHTLIRETKRTETHNGGFGTRTEDIDIAYDRSLEVPDAVHDVAQSASGSGSGNAVFDFKLTADSFARGAAPPRR